jgi:hypothetical protein
MARLKPCPFEIGEAMSLKVGGKYFVALWLRRLELGEGWALGRDFRWELR